MTCISREPRYPRRAQCIQPPASLWIAFTLFLWWHFYKKGLDLVLVSLGKHQGHCLLLLGVWWYAQPGNADPFWSQLHGLPWLLICHNWYLSGNWEASVQQTGKVLTFPSPLLIVKKFWQGFKPFFTPQHTVTPLVLEFTLRTENKHNPVCAFW